MSGKRYLCMFSPRIARLCGIASLLFALALGVVTALSARSDQETSAQREIIYSRHYGHLVLEYFDQAKADDLGVPLYPEAEVERSFVFQAEDYNAGEPQGLLAKAVLTTSDAPENVAAFYRKEMGEKALVESPPHEGEIFVFAAPETREGEYLAVRILSGKEGAKNRLEITRTRLEGAALLPPPAECEAECCHPVAPPPRRPPGLSPVAD